MGKKIAEEMDKQRVRFMEGAKEKGFDDTKAAELFDLMAKFAAYGFNKSHAAAYCVVAAYTAYLKKYYPVEFYAALLSTEMSDTDKVVKYVKDARRHDIKVKAPHVNYSDFRFNAEGEDVYFSLGAIKGVGEAAVNAIVEARNEQENGKFDTLEEFFGAIDLRRVNKKTLECLIKAGAMDGFGYNRAELAAGYVRFIERADIKQKDAESGQVSLFGMSEDTVEEEQVKLEPMEEWTRSAKLAYEKEVLGFYLSGHPLDGIDMLIKPMTTGLIKDLEQVESKSSVRVVGLASGIKEIITKKGTRMAFATLEDTSSSLELVVFPNTFKQYEAVLKSEGALLVTGNVEVDGNRVKILAEKLERAETVFQKAKRLVIKVSPEQQQKMALLKELFKKHSGKMECVLKVELPELDKEVDLQIKDPKGVQPTAEFFESVSTLLVDPEWRLV